MACRLASILAYVTCNNATLTLDACEVQYLLTKLATYPVVTSVTLTMPQGRL